ncbi:hypothetical protein [Roseimaritima sediminicola]|uniref:hypothetical protein n=1 Tax=Roseimaritima sediminicola TaxID=2662066 RepID=UPI0012983B1A|nr:hypothetical protein [Roseimaritima sediminicola]
MTTTIDLSDPVALGKISCGRIVVERGRVVALQRRLLPRQVSLLGVWLDSVFPRGKTDRCVLDFHRPWGSPGFLTLDYVRSGPQTSFRSFRRAVATLDQVARSQQVLAIVAHVSTNAISDRLLRRWGWQQHCLHWKGRHWIKRFDKGYPAPLEHRCANAEVAPAS